MLFYLCLFLFLAVCIAPIAVQEAHTQMEAWFACIFQAPWHSSVSFHSARLVLDSDISSDRWNCLLQRPKEGTKYFPFFSLETP